jgi:uncharacterized membrane protein YphA (DoxX/SURF4 family)
MLLTHPISIAVLLARLLLGILFIFQGYDKIFKVGVKGVIQVIQPSYRLIKVPRMLVIFVAYFTSYIEFFCGFLVFIGLFKFTALYLLGIDLLIVSFGLALIDPLPKMENVFPRFILILILLIIPREYDVFSLHRLLMH